MVWVDPEDMSIDFFAEFRGKGEEGKCWTHVRSCHIGGKNRSGTE
jgi:hypothetical protein